MTFNLNNVTFLIVFPNGKILEGKKLSSPRNHHVILEKMREMYPDFAEMTLNYVFSDSKEQVKLYNYLVHNNVIVYQAWSTFIGENIKNANIYLPKEITVEQKNIIDSNMEQFNRMNIIPYELCEHDYLDFSPCKISEGSLYLQSYIEEHLIKMK